MGLRCTDAEYGVGGKAPRGAPPYLPLGDLGAKKKKKKTGEIYGKNGKVWHMGKNGFEWEIMGSSE